jgi:hypothetical protein
MSTLDPTSTAQKPDRRRRASDSHLTGLIAGGAIGAILAVLAGAVLYPEQIGPLAYLAIAVIGSVAGAALGVLGVVAQHTLRVD